MEITPELVEYLEKLGRISLTSEEKEKTQKELGSILGYIDKLGELDTTGVEPLSHAFGRTNVTREDVVTNDDMQDKILRNSAFMLIANSRCGICVKLASVQSGTVAVNDLARYLRYHKLVKYRVIRGANARKIHQLTESENSGIIDSFGYFDRVEHRT